MEGLRRFGNDFSHAEFASGTVLEILDQEIATVVVMDAVVDAPDDTPVRSRMSSSELSVLLSS